MHILLIIFDGLADRPAPELQGKTPLEAAHTPNLDRLAAEGINGLLHPKSPGYPLGSPLALHLMFGYPEDVSPQSKSSRTAAYASSSGSSVDARKNAGASLLRSPNAKLTA